MPRTEHVPQWTQGDRLRKAREYAGLTQEQLAEAVGVARNTVVNYETGHTRPKLVVLRVWAEETQVPLEWLLGEPMVPQDAVDQGSQSGPWHTGSMRDRASTAA